MYILGAKQNLVRLNQASVPVSVAVVAPRLELEALRSAHPSATYIPLPDGISVPAARNLALSRVDTEFVAFLDADDPVNPEGFVKLCEIARNGGYSAVFGRLRPTRRVSLATALSTAVMWLPPGRLLRTLYAFTVGLPALNTASVIRTESLREAGAYFEAVPSLESWPATIRLIAVYRCRFLSESFPYQYRPCSMSRSASHRITTCSVRAAIDYTGLLKSSPASKHASIECAWLPILLRLGHLLAPALAQTLRLRYV